MSQYYTLRDAARRHGLSYGTLWRWCSRGFLKAAPRRVPGLLGPSTRLCVSRVAMASIPRLMEIMDARTLGGLREYNQNLRNTKGGEK